MNNNRNRIKLGEVFSPSKRFIKKTYSSAEGWDKMNNISFVLNRAIVVNIDLSIDNEQGSPITPPGSIYVKVIGEDVSTKNPNDDSNKWAIPLFTFHNISIPEIGEEVWAIRETDRRSSQLYWICRVSDSNFLNKVLAREDRANLPALYRYQLGFNVEDIAEEISQTAVAVFSVPFRPGDVLIQGRSDSYVRHSLNPRNREGVLESGIKERTRYERLPGVVIGPTKTKIVHAGNSNLNEVTTKPIRDDSGDSIDRDLLLKEAEVLVNVSTLEDSATALDRQVLGETLNEWLTRLKDGVKELNSTVGGLLETTVQSTQLIPSYSSKQTITLNLGKDQSVSFDVDVNIPQRETVIKPENVVKAQDLSVRLSSIADEIVKLEEKINGHLSNHQYIN